MGVGEATSNKLMATLFKRSRDLQKDFFLLVKVLCMTNSSFDTEQLICMEFNVNLDTLLSSRPGTSCFVI